MSAVNDRYRASNAAELVKMCLENASLGHEVFEKLYLMIAFSDEPNLEGSCKWKDDFAQIFTNSLRKVYIPKSTPIIFETNIDPNDYMNSDTSCMTKDDARQFVSFANFLTLISDNLVIIHEEGKEPAILVIERDPPNAPSGVAECMPGGWVGPGDFNADTHTLETAQLKLDNEIIIRTPHRLFKPSQFMMFDGYSEEVMIERLSRNVAINVDGIDRPLIARGVIPFFHKSAVPEANYDANMLNLLRVVKLNVKAGTHFEDASGFGREIKIIPISQFAHDRGVPMLPTVAFVRDRILPALKL